MIVIAHRGASGYVPEHTLVAKAIAHTMGADFLEQDVVATKDGHAVVLHDIHIDTVTDVAEKFADRRREDGRYYAIDLTLGELKSLRVRERFDHRSGRAVFPTRYPSEDGEFRIATLDEEIRFITHLNRTTSRTSGIYPEVKHPAWHREQGCDLSTITLDVLKRHVLDQPDSPCYVQCFDEFEVKRIREELSYRGKLIQLIGRGHDVASGSDFNRMITAEGLRDLGDLVDGIGPTMELVVTWDTEGAAKATELVSMAHRFGLAVHPWTARVDQLPKNCPSYESMIRALESAKVDGIFADQPDAVLNLQSKESG